MATPKRKRAPVTHQGRVTRPAEAADGAAPRHRLDVAPASHHVPKRRGRPAEGEIRPPAPTRRTTPPAQRALRPSWHKKLGWTIVVVGLLVIVLNDGMLLASATLLPFGHSELYLLLGGAIAIWGAWWCGVFDRSDRMR